MCESRLEYIVWEVKQWDVRGTVNCHSMEMLLDFDLADRIEVKQLTRIRVFKLGL